MLRARSFGASSSRQFRQNCNCSLIPDAFTGKVKHDEECEFLYTHGTAFFTDATRISSSSARNQQNLHENNSDSKISSGPTRVSEIELKRRQELRKQFLLTKNRNDQETRKFHVSSQIQDDEGNQEKMETWREEEVQHRDSTNTDRALQPSRAYIQYAKQMQKQRTSKSKSPSPSTTTKTKSPENRNPHVAKNNKNLIYISERSPQSQQEKVVSIFGSTKDRLSYFPNQGVVGTIRKISSHQERKATGCEVFDIFGKGGNTLFSRSGTSQRASSQKNSFDDVDNIDDHNHNKSRAQRRASPSSFSSTSPSPRIHRKSSAIASTKEKGPKNFVSTPYYQQLQKFPNNNNNNNNFQHSNNSPLSTDRTHNHVAPTSPSLSTGFGNSINYNNNQQQQHFSVRSMFSVPYSDESEYPMSHIHTRPAYSALNSHQQQILQQYQNSPFVSPSRRDMIKKMGDAVWLTEAEAMLMRQNSTRNNNNNNILLNGNALLNGSSSANNNNNNNAVSNSSVTAYPYYAIPNLGNTTILNSQFLSSSNNNHNNTNNLRHNSSADGNFETASSATSNQNQCYNSSRRKSAVSIESGNQQQHATHNNANISNNNLKKSTPTSSNSLHQQSSSSPSRNINNNKIQGVPALSSSSYSTSAADQQKQQQQSPQQQQNFLSETISRQLAKRYLLSFKSLLQTSGLSEERWFNGTLSVESRDAYMREWKCCALMRRLILENYDDLVEWASGASVAVGSGQDEMKKLLLSKSGNSNGKDEWEMIDQ